MGIATRIGIALGFGLIINQRAFQANTRTVSLTSELLANLTALGQ